MSDFIRTMQQPVFDGFAFLGSWLTFIIVVAIWAWDERRRRQDPCPTCHGTGRRPANEVRLTDAEIRRRLGI